MMVLNRGGLYNLPRFFVEGAARLLTLGRLTGVDGVGGYNELRFNRERGAV